MKQISKILQLIGNIEVLTPLNIYADVVSAAKANVHFEDFKTDGRLTGNFRQGYEARMSAFHELERQGFVKLENSHLALGTLSEKSWLLDAIVDGDSDAWRICDAFPDKSKKFEPDTIRRTEIGLQGELFVIDWLKQKLGPENASRIDHVSLRDDSAGFDISTPTLHRHETVYLEVKTTTRTSNGFRFFLSRNEWETSQQYSNWYLVLVQKNSGNHVLYGYLDGKSLGLYFPSDNHPNFNWTVSSGQLFRDDVFQSMPGF